MRKIPSIRRAVSLGRFGPRGESARLIRGLSRAQRDAAVAGRKGERKGERGRSRARGKGACGPDAERECRLVEATEPPGRRRSAQVLRNVGGRARADRYSSLRRGKILPCNPRNVAKNSPLNTLAPNCRGTVAREGRKCAYARMGSTGQIALDG